MLNNVNLCGRLTATPELKTTTNGISVTTFTLAVDRDYKNGEEKQADFINIVAWRSTAEFAAKYFQKVKMMIVGGSLQTRNYTDKNGNKRTAVEVVADKVWFAGDKAEPTQSPAVAPAAAPAQAASDFEEITADDDLPF